MRGFGKLTILCVLVTLALSGVSAESFLPEELQGTYPELSHLDGSSNLYVESVDGSNLRSDTNGNLNVPGSLADFDSDNNMEVATIDTSDNNKLKVYEFSGGGLDMDFTFSGDPTSKGSQRPLAVGDYYDNGNPDVFYNDASNGYIHVVGKGSDSTKLYEPGNTVHLAGLGDFDKDGEKELVWLETSSAIYSCELDDFTGASCDNLQTIYSSSNIRAKAVSNLADVTGDGFLDVSFKGNDGNLMHISSQSSGNPTEYNGGIKGKKFAMSYTFNNGERSEDGVELLLSNSNGRLSTCIPGSCSKKTPLDTPAQSTRSYIPAFTKEPVTNLTDGKISQGKTIKIKFNVTDYEGYSGILNSTAKANLTSPNGVSTVVEAEEFTKQSGVSGQSKTGGFVPDDGKTKAFKATYQIPDDAETGTWNVTVQVKDEKMTGTRNWTTFEVERALIEKNVSQNIAVTKEDTARNTDLSKISPTGLSFSSPSSILTANSRTVADALGFSRNDKRSLDLSKTASTVLGFSKSQSNLKSAFSSLKPTWSASTTLNDFYSTAMTVGTSLGFSSSATGRTMFDVLVEPDFGFTDSNSKGIFMRLPLSMDLSSSRNSQRTVPRNRIYSFNFSSNPPKINQDLMRSFLSRFSAEKTQNKQSSLGRGFYQGIDYSSTFSSTGMFFSSVNPVFSFTDISARDSGFLRSLNTIIDFDQGQQGSLDAPRTQEDSITASSDIGSRSIFARVISQSIGVELSLQDLVEFIECDLLNLCNEDKPGDNDETDDNTGRGSGDREGSITYPEADNSTENKSEDDTINIDDGNETLSESNESDVEVVEASLMEGSDNSSTVINEIDNLDEAQEILIDVQAKEDQDRSDTEASSSSDDYIEIETISFESSESVNQTEVQVEKIEQPETELETEKEVYEATNVSTNFGAHNAYLKYNVKKEFVESRNGSAKDLQVLRFKNGSKAGNLETELVGKNESFYKVQAKSPEGFSIFAVTLDVESPVNNPESFSLPRLPIISLLKVFLLFSSLYLLRKPLITNLLTIDIRVSYLANLIRYRLLKIYRKIEWSSDADTGRKEFELAEDVRSLENRKEALEFRKNKLEEEVERKRKIKERYENGLSELNSKIEEWKKKFRG